APRSGRALPPRSLWRDRRAPCRRWLSPLRDRLSPMGGATCRSAHRTSTRASTLAPPLWVRRRVKTALEIRRDGDIHIFRMIEAEVIHQLDILLTRLHLKPRVEPALLADRAHGPAAIIVTGVDERLIG